MKTLGADLGDVFTFENVEQLVFVVMQMTGRAAFLMTGMLDDK